jgi:hypothetical protein
MKVEASFLSLTLVTASALENSAILVQPKHTERKELKVDLTKYSYIRYIRDTTLHTTTQIKSE